MYRPDPDDLIGAVCAAQAWRFFAGTVAEWILDYGDYDPGYDPATSPVHFRAGLLQVGPDDGAAFCAALAPYEVTQDHLRALVQRDGAAAWPLQVLVDFDQRRYVNSFAEIDLHAYVPPGWQAHAGNPQLVLPPHLQALWHD